MKNILFLILSLCVYTEMIYGDIAWSTPVSISTVSVNATDPHVVIDSSGNATAVWVESGFIKAATLPFGGSWTVPTTLSLTNTASMPRVAIDSSGNVTAAWIENSLLESAILLFGGSWGVPTAVSAVSGVSNFSLDVDASGNGVLVWVSSGNIVSATRKLGIWLGNTTISTTTPCTNPNVKTNSNGQAIAVWHGLSSGSDVIISNTLTISSNTWGGVKGVTTASTAFHYDYPKVCMDSNGNATAIAFRYNFNATNGAYYNVQTITSTFTSGATTWGLGTLLSNSGIGNPANLTLKLKSDVNGDVLAMWTNLYDGMTYSIESATKVFGGNWPTPVVPQNFTLYSFGMDVGTSQGSAVLVNMYWDGVSNIQIVSQETDTTDPLTQAWTGINSFSTGSDNASPSCAISVNSSQLKAVAVWINYNGTNTTINASNGVESVISAPTSISAAQSSTNFGVYTDYSNTISWTDPSPSPTLIQYNLYRNGEFFASTPPGTLSFVDHNQIQSGTGSVIYGVSSLDSSFRQSAMITFTLH
jgi:hypothetical protein